MKALIVLLKCTVDDDYYTLTNIVSEKIDTNISGDFYFLTLHYNLGQVIRDTWSLHDFISRTDYTHIYSTSIRTTLVTRIALVFNKKVAHSILNLSM